MIVETVATLLTIASVVQIQRKGLTRQELHRLVLADVERLRKWVVNIKPYRWSSGHVWLKLESAGWVHARWVTDARDGYLVRLDNGPTGMTHKTYVGILKIEDYTKG